MEGNQSITSALCSNASDSSITEGAWEIESRTGGIISATFLLLLATVGLPCNLLIAWVILRGKMYKDPFIILLLNEAVCNLLLIFCVSFFHIPTGFRGEFGNAAPSDVQRCSICRAGCMLMIATFVLAYNSTFGSFDRFLFFYRPLRYDQFVNNTRLLLVLAAVWIISTIVAVLPVTGHIGEIRFEPFFLSCYPTLAKSAYGIFTAIFIAIPVGIWLVFNTLIAIIVFKNIRAIYASSKSIGSVAEWLSHDSSKIFQEMKKKCLEKEAHLTKAYFGLVFITLLTWLPIIVVGLAIPVSGRTDVLPTFMYQTAVILFFTQVVSEPFLDFVFIKELRAALKNAVPCHGKRSRTGENCGCCGSCGGDMVTLRRQPPSHDEVAENGAMPTSEGHDLKVRGTHGNEV